MVDGRSKSSLSHLKKQHHQTTGGGGGGGAIDAHGTPANVALSNTATTVPHINHSSDVWVMKYSVVDNRRFWKYIETGRKVYKLPDGAVTSTRSTSAPSNMHGRNHRPAKISPPSTSRLGEVADEADGTSSWEKKFSSVHNSYFWKNKITGKKKVWTLPSTPSNNSSGAGVKHDSNGSKT